MIRFLGVLFCSLALMSPSWAQSADGFPNKPIRIVVPYPPGGTSDMVARLVSRGLSAELGQPVIVENKGGASSTIGTAHVVRQPADGYTLLLVAAALVTNVATGIQAPYEPLRDLEPVANLAWMPLLVAANPKVPAKDLPSLIAWIRAQKDPVQYASPGAGSLTQLWGELMAQRYNLKLEHVTYKGSAGAVSATIAGDVPLLFDVVGTTSQMIAQGRLRGIVTPGNQRAPGLPDVPTAGESGVTDLQAQSFLGLMGPAGLPAAVRDKLNASVNKVLASPEVIETLRGQGLSAAGGTAQAFGKLLGEELNRWTAVAKTAGVRSAP